MDFVTDLLESTVCGSYNRSPAEMSFKSVIRKHAILEHIITPFVHKPTDRQIMSKPLAKFAYNNSVHTLPTMAIISECSSNCHGR